MKFKFDLEKVLNYREGLTHKAQAKHQLQLALVRNQIDHIDSLKNQIMDAFKLNQSKVEEGGLNSNFLQINSDMAVGLRKRIKLEHQKLRGLEMELEELKEVLVKRKREQKSLELLKGKKKQAFQLKQKKKEQKAMDDLMVMRHAIKGEP